MKHQVEFHIYYIPQSCSFLNNLSKTVLFWTFALRSFHSVKQVIVKVDCSRKLWNCCSLITQRVHSWINLNSRSKAPAFKKLRAWHIVISGTVTFNSTEAQGVHPAPCRVAEADDPREGPEQIQNLNLWVVLRFNDWISTCTFLDLQKVPSVTAPEFPARKIITLHVKATCPKQTSCGLHFQLESVSACVSVSATIFFGEEGPGDTSQEVSSDTRRVWVTLSVDTRSVAPDTSKRCQPTLPCVTQHLPPHPPVSPESSPDADADADACTFTMDTTDGKIFVGSKANPWPRPPPRQSTSKKAKLREK